MINRRLKRGNLVRIVKLFHGMGGAGWWGDADTSRQDMQFTDPMHIGQMAVVYKTQDHEPKVCIRNFLGNYSWVNRDMVEIVENEDD